MTETCAAARSCALNSAKGLVRSGGEVRCLSREPPRVLLAPWWRLRALGRLAGHTCTRERTAASLRVSECLCAPWRAQRPHSKAAACKRRRAPAGHRLLTLCLCSGWRCRTRRSRPATRPKTLTATRRFSRARRAPLRVLLVGCKPQGRSWLAARASTAHACPPRHQHNPRPRSPPPSLAQHQGGDGAERQHTRVVSTLLQRGVSQKACALLSQRAPEPAKGVGALLPARWPCPRRPTTSPWAEEPSPSRHQPPLRPASSPHSHC